MRSVFHGRAGEARPTGRRGSACRGGGWRSGTRTFGVCRFSRHEPTAAAVPRDPQSKFLQVLVNTESHRRICHLGARLDLPPFTVLTEAPIGFSHDSLLARSEDEVANENTPARRPEWFRRNRGGGRLCRSIWLLLVTAVPKELRHLLCPAGINPAARWRERHERKTVAQEQLMQRGRTAQRRLPGNESRRELDSRSRPCA